MRVTVRLFGALRDLAGGCGSDRDVPAGTTAREVWDQLTADRPALRPFTSVVAVAINDDFAPWTAPVGNGDEIAFLPPVSGG